MKRTRLDRFIGVFSPTAENRRVAARARTEAIIEATRAYNIGRTYKTSDWSLASSSSANAEVKKAAATGRKRARSLVENNPYAGRALQVIVSNTVGAGIVANIKGRSQLQTRRLQDLWKEWAETTLCDFEGQQNFYGLQASVMRTMVESGEGLALFRNSEFGPTAQILESDFLDSTKDDAKTYQGIEIGSDGKRVAYHLYDRHPGSDKANAKTNRIPADSIAHIYKKDRPGQVRGMTWAHSIAEHLNDLGEYQRLTLITRKIGACFGGFIQTDDGVLTPADLKARREKELALEPGMFKFLAPGESVQLANPPQVQGYTEFVRETLRAVASGYGITYEALTGDYSGVNFSSGRMGHMEMRRNIEHWRWNILIPMFCDPFFNKFLQYAAIKGISIDGVFVDWTPPAYVMIDPGKEIDADREAVKAGFKSRSQVIREQGYDPDMVLEEIKEERNAAKEAGVTFDTETSIQQPNQSGDEQSDEEQEDKESQATGS